MYFSFVSNPIGTLNSDEAEKLRVFFNRAKLESPDVVFEAAYDPWHFCWQRVFHIDVSADVQAAMEAVLRTPENLQKLSDLPHKFYPSDVIVGSDADGEGNFLVSISSRNSTFSRRCLCSQYVLSKCLKS